MSKQRMNKAAEDVIGIARKALKELEDWDEVSFETENELRNALTGYDAECAADAKKKEEFWRDMNNTPPEAFDPDNEDWVMDTEGIP